MGVTWVAYNTVWMVSSGFPCDPFRPLGQGRYQNHRACQQADSTGPTYGCPADAPAAFLEGQIYGS